MPLLNHKDKKKLELKVIHASNLLARLAGIRGLKTFNPQDVLYIDRCNSIHTFGLTHPIDVAFLNKDGRIVKLMNELPPKRITNILRTAYSVLEFPANTIKRQELEVGDVLEVSTDCEHRAGADALRTVFHWPVNFFIAFLWGMFVNSAVSHWLAHSGILSFGLVLVNTLLLFLFLTRRESKEISHFVPDWLIPIGTVGLSMILRPVPDTNAFLAVSSLVIQVAGIFFILSSLVSLGRSFGVIPANREIKRGGTYQLVRHPLYASELLFYLGFLLGNMSAFNTIAIVFILLGQIYRVFAEEKLLNKDQLYSEYMNNTKYRFLPGIF
jgi:protein-S-isoprenylcysteine O-methyltransferase Ste14/uncharacterized membrane protein (UPF0127 family)